MFRDKRNITLNELDFYNRKQTKEETFDTFMAELRRLHALAELCGTCQERTLRAHMLIGMQNSTARKAILKHKKTPSLAECI